MEAEFRAAEEAMNGTVYERPPPMVPRCKNFANLAKYIERRPVYKIDLKKHPSNPAFDRFAPGKNVWLPDLRTPEDMTPVRRCCFLLTKFPNDRKSTLKSTDFLLYANRWNWH